MGWDIGLSGRDIGGEAAPGNGLKIEQLGGSIINMSGKGGLMAVGSSSSPGWPQGGGGSGLTGWDLASGALQVAGGFLSDRASAKESKRNRDWQEDFYKKRYQYQMADMKAAGLNPIMAYQQNPGGVPSGGVASQGAGGEGIRAAVGSVQDYLSKKNAISIQKSAAISAAAQAQIDAHTANAKTKGLGIGIKGGDPGDARSRIEKQLDAEIEATGSSAKQSAGIAETQKSIRELNAAMAGMNDAQRERLKRATANDDVTEMQKILIGAGVKAVGGVVDVLRKGR